jgi:creatinine amidohydrolase/Fe(II)-dependent formamide hydrolase-like protein
MGCFVYYLPAVSGSWRKTRGLFGRVDLAGRQGEDKTSSPGYFAFYLYLQPHLVKMDKAVTDYGKPGGKNYPGYQPGLFSRDPKDPAYSKTGLFGDPKKAEAEKGKKVLEIMTANWIRILKGFAKTPLIIKK